MKKLHLRYVGSVTPITGILHEHYETDVGTIRDLLNELELKYGGFHGIFLEEETGKLKLNAMIYYREQGKTPMAAIDLDQPIRDGAEITFW